MAGHRRGPARPRGAGEGGEGAGGGAAIHVPGLGGVGGDVEQVRLRLAALGRELCCPLCGGRHFTRAPGLDEGIKLLYERPGSTPATAGGYLPVFAIGCTGCGHVLLFERRAVLGDVPTPLL